MRGSMSMEAVIVSSAFLLAITASLAAYTLSVANSEPAWPVIVSAEATPSALTIVVENAGRVPLHLLMVAYSTASGTSVASPGNGLSSTAWTLAPGARATITVSGDFSSGASFVVVFREASIGGVVSP